MKKNTKLIFVVLVMIVLVIMLTNCDLNGVFYRGTLSIQLESSMKRDILTLVPDLDMDIETYTITGSGPNVISFTEENFAGVLFVKENLEKGTWEITIDGYNSIGTKIGTKTLDLTVKRRKTTSSTVTLSPLEGTGTFLATVSWEDNDSKLIDPEVWITIRDEEGNDIDNVSDSIQLSVSELTATGSKTLPNDWYEVTVTLKDGNSPIWQGIFAVRIVNGQTTNGTIEIPAELIESGTGSVSVEIQEDMEPPLAVSFSGMSETVEIGSTVELSSTGTYSGSEQYRWYVNGVKLQDETSSNLSYTFDETGTYTVALFVLDEEVLGGYQKSVEITVTPDLIPAGIYAGKDWFNDREYGVVGDLMSIVMYIKNEGNIKAEQDGVDIALYLSEDKEITSSDILLATKEVSIDIPTGETEFFGWYDITVPNVSLGTYYIGCILDVNNEVDEISTANNINEPQDSDTFSIVSTTTDSEGALKIVNSWGEGEWENIADGHYWITYDSAKVMKLPVVYFKNNFSQEYEPTIIAVFNIDHPEKDKCQIKLGIGELDNPIIVKDFQSRWSTNSYAGEGSFPNNDMVLDISEFAPYINSNNLFLTADTSTGGSSGTLTSFMIEYYDDYDSEPIKIIEGSTGEIKASDCTEFTATTIGELTSTENELIVSMSSPKEESTKFNEEYPDALTLNHDKEIVGVYDENKNYNIIIDGKYGTGSVPPTNEQWETMKKLKSVNMGVSYGVLPNEVDNSDTPYFPPIGYQGREGSCTAWAIGYYIQTYNEAKEHGWDLSSTGWDFDETGCWYPLSNQDKIISPDFLYHQVNGGTPGSNGSASAGFVVRVGGCSWEQMPYSDKDDDNYQNYETPYPWPKESAYREAPLYRGQGISPRFWYSDFLSSGYFIIESDADINMLKQLLAAGFCVSVSVEAYKFITLLNDNDVISDYSGEPFSPNHANTIVGYKEGTSWDIDNPEN